MPTRTTTGPSGPQTQSVVRLRQVASEISAHIGVDSITPAALFHVLNVHSVRILVGRGQPHKVYGTRTISRDDLDRLLDVPAQQLEGDCYEGALRAVEDGQ